MLKTTSITTISPQSNSIRIKSNPLKVVKGSTIRLFLTTDPLCFKFLISKKWAKTRKTITNLGSSCWMGKGTKISGRPLRLKGLGLFTSLTSLLS